MPTPTHEPGQPIILTAMQSEYDAVLAVADSAQNEKRLGPLHFRVLETGGLKIAVARVGMGHVNAALATTAAILTLEPSTVFSCGVAGALIPGPGVGGVIVGSEYVNGGADARPLGSERGGLPGEPLRYPGDPSLVEHARAAKATVGTMLSSDVFIDAEYIEGIRRAFPDAISCDMESSAVAQVCHKFGTRFLSVRGISDNAAGTGAQEFLRENVRVGHLAAQFTLMLARLAG